MRPRTRAVILLAAILLVVTGLLVAGPAHLGLHGAGDGPTCEACAIHGAAPPVWITDLGPPRLARIEPDLPPAAEPPASTRLLPPARGPPRTL